MAAASSLLCWIALSTSPGFETRDQSIFCFGSLSQPWRPGTVLPATLEVLAYPLGFIFFQRAGVRLLLGHADSRQSVKDRPALYFQLAC